METCAADFKKGDVGWMDYEASTADFKKEEYRC
jgi:hypothetical protein